MGLLGYWNTGLVFLGTVKIYFYKLFGINRKTGFYWDTKINCGFQKGHFSGLRRDFVSCCGVPSCSASRCLELGLYRVCTLFR